MKKKIGELTDEEIIEMLDDNKCKYCFYESIDTPEGTRDCPKKVKCCGGEPVYPLCWGNDFVLKEIADNYRDNNDLEQEVEVEE